MEPAPFIVAVVDGDVALAISMAVLVEVQELKVWPGFAVAEIEIVWAALYHAVPTGLVDPSPGGLTANATENWF